MPTRKQPETRAWTCVCVGRRTGHTETSTQYAATAREARYAAKRKWCSPNGWEPTTCTVERNKASEGSEVPR